MDDYILGLDWINRRSGWAYCSFFPNRKENALKLGQLPLAEDQGELVRGAARIVLDAPIGLLASGKNRVGQERRPDEGAKCWIGAALTTSVITPPYRSELKKWRGNGRQTKKGEGGHIRGLLPAIDSAERVRRANIHTLESHPELVFALLMGKPLPAEAAKTTLLGTMVRLGIAGQYGYELTLGDLISGGRTATDNFIDAVALALLARDWYRSGDLRVIRKASGLLEPLGTNPKKRIKLMAVPDVPDRTHSLPPATTDELIALAERWQRRTDNAQASEKHQTTTHYGPTAGDAAEVCP